MMRIISWFYLLQIDNKFDNSLQKDMENLWIAWLEKNIFFDKDNYSNNLSIILITNNNNYFKRAKYSIIYFVGPGVTNRWSLVRADF